jgi:hypothetical protein
MRVVLSIGDAHAVRILASAADSNYLSEDCLSVFHRGGNEQNTLLRFDLAPVPVDREITCATLHLTHDSSIWPTGDYGFATWVFRLTKPWIPWQVTWNSREGYRPSDRVPWDRPGGDFVGIQGRSDGSDPYASTSLNLKDHRFPGLFPLAVDVTALVREWRDGVYPNYGLLLTGEEGTGLHFRSDRGDDPLFYPTLTVDFE